jgi:hypothetical protein
MTEPKVPLIVVFPRGQLSAKDKERLTKAGVIAVEAETPEAVRQLHLAPPLINTKINGDGLVRAALQALAEQSAETLGGNITTTGRASHQFVKYLAASLDVQP